MSYSLNKSKATARRVNQLKLSDTQVNDSKYVAREENISGYTEDLMDNIENYANGKLEYKDLYNDIVSVEVNQQQTHQKEAG